MKKGFILFVWLMLLTASLYAQTIVEHYTKRNDSLRIGKGPNDFLPYNEKGYTLMLPDSSKQVEGVIISLEEGRFDVQAKPKQNIHPQATANGLAVLYISTGVPADLYFSPQTLPFIDTTIQQVIRKFKLPTEQVSFLGVSLGGHRALKYITALKEGRMKAKLQVKSVILCDGVLDWVRQWYEEKKGVRDNFAPSAVFEGKMITYLLETQLKGTPKTNGEAYLAFSPYSYFDETNRYLKHYKDLALRAYTEPATYYWMNERRKGVFDTNFPDMVGIINELKLQGNTRSELIVFQQDKANNDRRNPFYTWELVDKEELVQWIVAQMK